jgi:SSS family solute:Na+ symporter
MADTVIIALYFLAMLAVGAYVYRRRQASTNDGFFVANRSGSTLLITASLAATFIGASVAVGMAGRGYRMGLPGAWWLLVGAVGLLVLGLFLARRVRRYGLYTLPELVERQYGAAAGIVASILIVVAWIAVAAGQIIAAGKVLSVLIPWELAPLMAIAAAVFILYTALGGQYSIIRTDFFQFGMLAVGILVALGFVIVKAGGIGEFAATLPSEYFSFPVNSSFGWYDLVLFLILTGSTYVVGPDIYSRLFSARSENAARSSAFWAAGVAIPIAFIIVLIGMGAMVLYPGLADSELAFPTVIENLLPIGVSGLVLAALLAAIMSSADTVLLTTSTILSQDILKKLTPRISERTNLLISRVGVLIIGALALAVALQLKGIISSLFLAYTVFTSGLVVPVVAGFYRNRLKVNSAGAIAAIVGGGGTALAVKQLNMENLELLGFGVCILLLFGVSWITRRTGIPENGD